MNEQGQVVKFSAALQKYFELRHYELIPVQISNGEAIINGITYPIPGGRLFMVRGTERRATHDADYGCGGPKRRQR